jgi:hypothetical protein
VLPADERFQAVDASVSEAGFGLVEQAELSAVDGVAELDQQPELVDVVLVVGRVVQHRPDRVALGLVHGDVGALQELLDRVAVLGEDSDADAGVHCQGDAIHDKRALPQHLAQAARRPEGPCGGLAGRGAIRRTRRAKPRHGVTSANGAAQGGGDLA